MNRIVSIATLVLALSTAPARADDLAGLEWLAGHWVSEDGAAEEVWLAPRGGSMSGSFRWVFPDGRTVLEYLVIEATAEATWLRFKHYGTNYVPWEEGAPVTYELQSLEPGRAEFNLVSEHEGLPQRYRYLRSGEGLSFTGMSAQGEESLRIDFRLRAGSGPTRSAVPSDPPAGSSDVE